MEPVFGHKTLYFQKQQVDVAGEIPLCNGPHQHSTTMIRGSGYGMFIENQPPLCYFPWGCLCAMHTKGTIDGKSDT